MHFAASADSALIVTTPEPTAITDGYAVIKLLAQRSYTGRMSLLSNMAADRQEARATYQRVSTVARQFLDVSLFDAGYVLTDPKLREAVRRRQPLVLAYPHSPASRCLAALATKIFSGGAFVSHGEGFFRRVVNWFA
jgi:flagellar biosynthesis protein FlhG